MEARESRQNQLARTSPFTLLQRLLMDDIASVFDRSGARGGQPSTSSGTGALMTWAPKVDVKQRGNELAIAADLPGVDPNQVTVEVTEDAVVIAGTRDEQRVEDNGDIYKVERTFGAIFREIPLPQGALVDQAKAAFKDGVLEISVPAPPAPASRRRRLEITRDGSKQDPQHRAEEHSQPQRTE